jgi:probable F420-dependent oxidoreductase
VFRNRLPSVFVLSYVTITSSPASIRRVNSTAVINAAFGELRRLLDAQFGGDLARGDGVGESLMVSTDSTARHIADSKTAIERAGHARANGSVRGAPSYYTRGVEFGIGYFATHDAVDPGALARLVEQRGHESLFFPEHTHIPASRDTPYPAGGELPRKYSHSYDLFVALSTAAATTSKLRVASGICLVIERDPITTAKEVASVDHLSGGRLEFGVGAGWNREEMLNHGTDPRVRMAILAERIEAMKAIWTQDEASYHGEYVNFDRIWSWPKPAQWPHPPVLVGGNGPTVLDRVVRFGDAWLPNYLGDVDDLLGRVRELRERAERPIDVIVMGVPAKPAVLEEFEKAGIRRVVRWIPSAVLGPVERALERWEGAIAELHGE